MSHPLRDRPGAVGRGSRAALLVLITLLAGCATPPESLQGAPARSPDPAEVRAEPERWAGERVQWGGRILAVENGAEATWVTVLAQPLAGNGRPENGSDGSARFMARFEGFRDPLIYEPGRDLTVIGRVDGIRTGEVGDYAYPYPVVAVDGHELWAPRPEPEPLRRYPYYDPFWGPFWGPGYPCYRHPRYCW